MTAFLEVLLVLWGVFGLYVAAVSVAGNSSDGVLLLLLGGSAALFSFALAAVLELLAANLTELSDSTVTLFNIVEP